MRRTSMSLDREDGIAMVTAILVSFVVFLLSIAVVRQAIHNVDASGYDQGRLRSVSAAEAGLNWAFNQLEHSDVEALWTGTDGTPLSFDVGSGPVSVEVEVVYYEDEEGTIVYDPATASAVNPPAALKVASVGTTPAGETRRMESFAVLTPIPGGLTGAVISNSNMTITNNFNLSGNNGNDGDIIVETGNFIAPSGIENIRGNIHVPNGYADITTNAHVFGTVWAGGSPAAAGFVRVQHPQAQIDGDVKSAYGAVTVHATADVLGSAYYCTGSAPGAAVQGSKIQTCSLGPPPTQSFPFVEFSASVWGAEGFYVKDFGSAVSACTDARTWMLGTTAGTYNKGVPSGGTGIPLTPAYTGVAIVTPSACQFTSVPAMTKVEMGTDLAIVAHGGVNLANNTIWEGKTTKRDLFFLSPYTPSTRNCPTQNVTIQNLNTFTNVDVSVYTVCTATVSNNNTFNGQIVGHTTVIQGNFTMNYRPVLIPGTDVIGFEQDVAYIREVAV